MQRDHSSERNRFLSYWVSALLLIFTTGCIARSVPRTSIAGSIGGRPFKIEAPKDISLSQLKISADTNGVVSISIESLTARMNPDVITTTAEGQVKMIHAIGEQMREASAKAAGKAVGVP
jgi:hypothetical protein